MCVTDFVTLDQLDERTLSYTRNAKPYATPRDIQDDFMQVFAALAKLSTKSMGLLVDLRSVRGRNDTEFERAHASHRAKLVHAFARVALVVVSSAGRLQVTRYAEQDAAKLLVFHDKDQALAWLHGTP